MDSIFDEDVDEVGGEIEAYCPSPRCKADTTHTIISMYEDEVRRVQCVVCGDVHAYRKPRGDSAEEPTAAQAGDAPRRRVTKMTWADALSRSSDADLTNCRPYSIRDTYEEGDIVSHPVFDIGMVTELLPDNKVEITFKEGPRILVHNRGDLAPRMPGISEAPPPREQKKKKRAKKKEDPAVTMQRPPKDLGEALEMARQAAAAKIEGGPPPKAPPAKGGKAAAAKPEPVKAAKGPAKAAPAKAPAKAEPKAAKGAAPGPGPGPGKTPAKKGAAPAAKKPAAPAKKPAAAKAAKKPAPKAKAKPAAKKPAVKAKPAAKKPAPKKPAPKAKAKPAAKKPAAKKKK